MMKLFFVPGALLIPLLSICGTAPANGTEDWDDVVVTEVNVPVTLACSDWPLNDKVQLDWQWKPIGHDIWSLVLSADERLQLKGGASKTDMRFADTRYLTSGDFSLYFVPSVNDGGRYSCAVAQGEKRERRRVTLLVILTVSISPTPPVPKDSILRLLAGLSSPEAVFEVSWFSPLRLPLRTQTLAPGQVISKLPNFSQADEGNYTCQVTPKGKVSRHHFLFSYRITTNIYRAAEFTDFQSGTPLPVACVHGGPPLRLSCADVVGDFVRLYWQPPERRDLVKIFSYDRWRDASEMGTKSRLRLADKSGRFAFLLEPELKEGGVYRCEVFMNDNIFIQGTSVSVLKVYSKPTASMLSLYCQYSFRNQVRRVTWTHQNSTRKLRWNASALGRVQTDIPLPLGPHVTGNYTCTLELKNGPSVRAVYAVTLPHYAVTTVSVSTNAPSPAVLPPLSVLGLLVPLVAVAVVVCVFLWKRGHHNTRPGVEQSLSHHSGEVENVYESPEDLRQPTGQSSVYMDLKPTSDDDVYKELDRYEQCPC